MSAESDNRWFRQNAKWFVPLLGALLLISIGGIAFAVIGLTRSSDVYRMTVALARSAPAVAESLGEPIDEGYFTTGSIRVSGPSGHASLAIPLSGPKGSGTAYVEATKALGQWSLSQVVFAAPSGERIDLIAATAVTRPGANAAIATDAIASRPTDTAPERVQPEFVVNKWRSTQPVWVVLADLTRRFGRSDVLEALRVGEDGSVEIRAVTGDGSALGAALATTDGLTGAHLQDAQTDARTQQQRVLIAARRRTDAQRDDKALGSPFLASRDDGGAYSELGRLFQEGRGARAPATEACTTISSQSIRDATAEPYRRASLQVRLRCSLTAVAALLSGLEDRTSPLLFVDQLDLSPLHGYVPPGAEAPPPVFDLRLTVHGYQDRHDP